MPIGPQNRIEPGGPDQGQPTHFLVGRGWGTTAIKVPKDFGDKKLTWTLTTNGKTVQGIFGLQKGYQIEPFLDAAMGNKPPTLAFEPKAKGNTGPPPTLAQAQAVSGAAGEADPAHACSSPTMVMKNRRPVAVPRPRPPQVRLQPLAPRPAVVVVVSSVRRG